MSKRNIPRPSIPTKSANPARGRGTDQQQQQQKKQKLSDEAGQAALQAYDRAVKVTAERERYRTDLDNFRAKFKISESRLQETDAKMEKLKKELAEAKTAAASAEAEVEKMKVEEKKKLEEADTKGYEAGIKRAALEYTQTAHQMVNDALKDRLPEFFELGYAAGAEAMATVLVVETDTQFRQQLPTIAAVVLCFTAVAAENLKTFTVTYGPFNSSIISDIFQFEGAAGILDNSLQMTKDFFENSDGSSVSPGPVNQAGRLMLNQSFKLWEQGYNKTSDRIASFNSSFLFNIDPFSGKPMGEGLAFIIAPNMSLPSNSSGQYLGLTNNDTDGHPENQLFAIELDNVKQDFDPDNNHVGLNINSIISNVNTSLTPWGIEISSINESSWFYNVWVQYDGINKVIEVYIAQQAEPNGETPSRPSTPVLKSNLDLDAVLNQYSYFGFSGSTGSGSQLNGIFRWNLTVDSYQEDLAPAPAPAPASPLEDKHPSLERTLLIVGVGVGVPLLVMGAALTGYCNLCKKRSVLHSESNILLGALKRLPGTPREFQFKDLKKATNNFDENNKLGQGGFGVVYRGHLQNENLEVAVKRFSRETVKGQDDFLAELTIINCLRHKHLVRLLGIVLFQV
ncbi:hypothetical protein RHGRI_022549 [Rhododendron griersonianum]|uniref:Protein kinase domain-containing protein n=1 Tax=Rhododendron griersonianum TaxID=479676 RepID=A0AAV6J5J9_9ERIC|nr:hypothetical protein RHGRI_022549 [Rhododendron griersonianum]